MPRDPEDFLHGAACHCCCFASETSCEKANRFLDRRFLLVWTRPFDAAAVAGEQHGHHVRAGRVDPAVRAGVGPGCTNCQNLEKATRAAVAGLGLDATIEKVTDYPAIAGYGVMSTPALVVDERLLIAGRVPTARQIRELLTAAASPAGTSEAP